MHVWHTAALNTFTYKGLLTVNFVVSSKLVIARS